jgi:hypothetical protein
VAASIFYIEATAIVISLLQQHMPPWQKLLVEQMRFYASV